MLRHVCSLLLACTVASAVEPMPRQALTPITASLLGYPDPKLASLSDGRFYTAYELLLANATGTDIELLGLEIRDLDPAGKFVQTMSADAIKARLRLPGRTEPGTIVPAGQSGYLRINLSFGSREEAPRAVLHDFAVKPAKPLPTLPPVFTERVARVHIYLEPVPAISPPLRGDRWVAAAVNRESYHRTAIMPINGRWCAPERWAVDFIQLDEKNRIASGDPSRNESFPQYGREVLAVADGLVVSVEEGHPDEPPGQLPAGMTLEGAPGNMVLQDIDREHRVLYAHLQPGSVKVKAGDRVKKGQLLGLLGNSGNTDAPHLHFHVLRGMAPLAGDGVPYVFDSFVLKGTVVSTNEMESELENPQVPVTVKMLDQPETRRREMPASMSIVEFPDAEPAP